MPTQISDKLIKEINNLPSGAIKTYLYMNYYKDDEGVVEILQSDIGGFLKTNRRNTIKNIQILVEKGLIISLKKGRKNRYKFI